MGYLKCLFRTEDHRELAAGEPVSQVALGPLPLEVHSQLWGPGTNNGKETDWTKTLTRVRQRIRLSACTSRGEGLPWRGARFQNLVLCVLEGGILMSKAWSTSVFSVMT